MMFFFFSLPDGCFGGHGLSNEAAELRLSGPEGLGWENTWQKSDPLPAPQAPAERAVPREVCWVPGTQTAAMGNWCCTRSL